jgi:cell surface protein SprA
MRSAFAWSLASTPDKTPVVVMILMDLQDLSYGFKRAKMSWYTIDPIYAQNQTEFQMTFR